MASKRNTKVSIARTSAYNVTASPAVTLLCEDANIESEPQKYERISNASFDPPGSQAAGWAHKFYAKGIEPDAATVGYLMYLALGGQSMNVSDQHVLVPDVSPQYLQFFVDKNFDLGTSTPTQSVIGGIITQFDLDVQVNKYTKLSIDGVACERAALSSALTATEPDYPLNWHALRAGDFKIAYNGVALASDRSIRAIKINYQREVPYDENITLDSDQPVGLTATGRKVSFEITRRFEGVQAKAEYAAWLAQQDINVQLLFSMNSAAETVQIDLPYGTVDGHYDGPGGSGDDLIDATLKCSCYQPSGGEVMTVTVDDATIVDYT